MPAPRTLTPYFCDNVKSAPDGKRVFYWDKQVPGLALRVTDGGARSWVVQKRLDRKVRRWTAPQAYVGGAKTDKDAELVGGVAWARAWARKILADIERGNDPDRALDRERIDQARKRANTVASVAADFIKLHASKNRSGSETERILEVYVSPKWGPLPITDVRRRDVAKLLDDIETGVHVGNDGKERGGPVMADRVLAAIRKMFNWYATRDDDFVSPIVRGMARTKPAERARERTLTDDEIRAIWWALDSMGEPAFAAATRLQLLLCRRRSEVSDMERAELDSGDWTLPAARNKVKQDLLVPLSRLAQEIIDKAPKVEDCEFVFAGRGKRPIGNWSKWKREIDEKSGVTDWIFHDLRRTGRTLLSRAKVPNEIAERVMGHKQAVIVRTYNKYEYADEKRQALELLSDVVQAILKKRELPIWNDRRPVPKRPAKVVSLRKGA